MLTTTTAARDRVPGNGSERILVLADYFEEGGQHWPVCRRDERLAVLRELARRGAEDVTPGARLRRRALRVLPEGGATTAEVAARLAISRARALNALDELEAQDLVAAVGVSRGLTVWRPTP